MLEWFLLENLLFERIPLQTHLKESLVLAINSEKFKTWGDK